MRRVKQGAVLSVVLATVLAATALIGISSGMARSQSVRVPKLTGTFVARGYSRLHAIGLRITIPRGFVVDDLAGGGEILATSPSAGQKVPIGSTVSLSVGCKFCALGSPAVPTHLSTYVVPSFVHRPLEAVLGWIGPKALYLTEHFAALHAAAAPRLVNAYRVARQRPAPGAKLRLGIGHRTGSSSRRFLPTPLSVWLVQSS